MRSPITYLRTLRSTSLVLALLALGHVAVAQETAPGDDLTAQDPHGWVLTLTSVSVVFLALVSLIIVFTVIGRLFSKRTVQAGSVPTFGVASPPASPRLSAEAEVAVAMALRQWQAERDAEIMAVIALALDAELNVQHDQESFTLTIQRRATQWNARSLGLRQGI